MKWMLVTGRMSRLINCLNGFSNLVKVNISDNEQIGNIIALLQEKHLNNSNIKEIIEKELLERGYDKETIKEWLEYI